MLIYVFDVESRELEKDLHYYQSCLEAILQNSPEAKIFCLVHKMDLIQVGRKLISLYLFFYFIFSDYEIFLTQEDQRDLIFLEREEELKKLSKPLDCTCFRSEYFLKQNLFGWLCTFRTSIWDETLYKAWSSIVYMLIPNVKEMESALNEFAEILDADEVLLFEKATFLGA